MKPAQRRQFWGRQRTATRSWNGVRFDVLEVEGNRIEKIGVTFNERPVARRPEDDPFGDDRIN